jgi:RluA family pseudouridine synthase
MNITAGKTDKIIDILLEEFGTASKTKVRKLISTGCIRCNGKIVKRSETIVNEGDSIEYTKYKEDVNKVRPPYPILFEDDYLVAINKPAGALMHGETGKNNLSVLKAMNQYIKESSRGKKHAIIIHRLDREVAGIVILAKTEEVLASMKDNWKNTEKLYFALTEGAPTVDEGSITSWIANDFEQKVKSVPEGTPEAKLAITHYRVLEKFDKNTLLEVRLETGRKNQIRLHFSEMGCPIVGDRRYGADATFVRQIRLFAFSLSFTHPITNEKVMIDLPMPHYFLKLKEADEKYK